MKCRKLMVSIEGNGAARSSDDDDMATPDSVSTEQSEPVAQMAEQSAESGDDAPVEISHEASPVSGEHDKRSVPAEDMMPEVNTGKMANHLHRSMVSYLVLRPQR